MLVTSPVSGSAQNGGFTSPTYTLATDQAPESNGQQQAVTAFGGTVPVAVDAHSVARPFTFTAVRPKNFKFPGTPNPATGVIPPTGRNVYTFLTRKGVTPLSGQASQVMLIRTTVEVPAGADLADLSNVRAALSLHIGALNQASASIGDLAGNGVLP